MDDNSTGDKVQGRSGGAHSGDVGCGDTRVGGNNDAIVTELRRSDVVLTLKGWPISSHLHPGNVQFQELVSNRVEEYHNSNKKDEIAKAIASSVSNKNGRFVQRVVADRLGVPSGTTAWVIMDQSTVVSSIRMVLDQKREDTNPNFITEPRPNDVLWSDTTANSQHIGNVQLRAMVATHAAAFRNSSFKKATIKSIVDNISRNNGRFLREVSVPDAGQLGVPKGSTAWLIMDQGSVNQKIQQALRQESYSSGCDSVIGHVTPLDVLKSFSSLGLDPYPNNMRFHMLLASEMPAFSAAKTSGREWQIAESVVFRVLNGNGRFLRVERNVWVCMDHNSAIELTLQTFRSAADHVGKVLQEPGPLNPTIQPGQQSQSRWGGIDVTLTFLAAFEQYDILRISFYIVDKMALVHSLAAAVRATRTIPTGLRSLFPGYTTVACVHKVWSGTYAERAGLLEGDVLCSVDWDECESRLGPDGSEQAAIDGTKATGRGSGFDMRLMTESEFEQDLRRSQKGGHLTFCVVRRRSVQSVASDFVREKRAHDSTSFAVTTAELRRPKLQHILRESLSRPRPFEEAVAAHPSSRGDTPLPLHDGPTDALGHDGDEMPTDHGAVMNVNGGPADFDIDETANVFGTNMENFEAELDSTPQLDKQEQAQLQMPDVAYTRTPNGQETSHATQEHEKAMSMAPSKSTVSLVASNVSRADAPTFLPADTGRSQEDGSYSGSDGIQPEEAPVGQVMPASAPQGSPTAEDLKQDKGLGFCLSKMSSIRARNIRLLTKHSDLFNELESLYTDQTIRSAMPNGFDRSRRKFKIEKIPLPSHRDDEIDMGEQWLRWYACIVIQNARLRSTIERQECKIKDLCEYKQLVDQAERAAVALLQQLTQRPTEAEAGHEAVVADQIANR